ncbi:hypothetical protein TRFO_12562 [Tritrichomonas foetus]|uniref:Uncharacterized protein n=1 Tax=Tritrichomonas foetus TaxID=1144522 RepID=A0A1J4L5K2_9EUKA|nr:hypothetical protein TRFO_12562 [Tritrichomonas foetus]|eukprot:OHT17229.1 hypothetical protein TRFO_12562 [Tritrichomonas foetus]
MNPNRSAPFVFIQRRGKNERPLRIPLERTMPALIESCISALHYPDDTPTLTLYNEDGEQISNIKNVLPDMLLLVSNAPPENHDQKSRYSNRQNGGNSNHNWNDDSSSSDYENDENEADDDFLDYLESDDETSFNTTNRKNNDGKSSKTIQMNGREHRKQFRKIAVDRENLIIHSIYSQYVGKYFHNNSSNIDSSNFSHFIQQIITSGLYSAPGGSSVGLSFRTVLLGPPQSGKSTLLKILSREIYQQIYQLGEMRETFMFTVDFREIKNELNATASLYRSLINTLVDQIAIQYPLLKVLPPKDTNYRKFNKNASLNFIREFLLQFAEFNGKFEPLSSKFPHQEPFMTISASLNSLGACLSESAQDRKSLKGFFNDLAILPLKISQIFGFSKVHFTFDHVDEADLDLNTGKGHISLSSFIKLMLSTGTFVISCSDEHHMYDICESVDNDDIDLKTSSSFVSCIDTFDEAPTCDFHFELNFEDIPKPIILQIEDCGGCGGYISKWERIMDICHPVVQNMIQSPKKKNIESRIIEKAKLKAILLLRQLAPMLLADQDPKTQVAEEITSELISFELVVNGNGDRSRK